MESRQIRSRWIMFLSVVVVVVLSALLVNAGKLEPNQPPGPTMKTLQEVYDAASSGINEREGFCQVIRTQPSSNTEVFTVEAGKRFVLLKLHTIFGGNIYPLWHLKVNGTLLMYGSIVHSEVSSVTGVVSKATHDFPDRCVIVNAGETLTIFNEHLTATLDATVIGYSYNVP